MIHYHGGPITPETCAVRAWRGRHAMVSSAHRQGLNVAISVSQSFCLDNGAFSVWKSGNAPRWSEYYEWVAGLCDHPRFDFAVVPDVIGGTEAENDALLASWPFPAHKSAPVWHTNESVERLQRLACHWPRVALGSSAEFDASRPAALVRRLREVLPFITGPRGYPFTKLHGLRMLNPRVFEHVPLASADSTNVARNIGLDQRWTGSYAPATREARVDVLAGRVEASVSPCRLEHAL